MEKKNTGLTIIIILGLLVIGLGGFVVYDKFIKNESNVSDTNNNINDNSSLKMSGDEAKKIVEKLYEDAYIALAEGGNLHEYKTYELTDEYHDYKCYKADLSPIEKYFTLKSYEYIVDNFTHKFDDGIYHCSEVDGVYYPYKVDFLASIFGMTDQELRDIKVISYNDEYIVALGQTVVTTTEEYTSTSSDKYPFYIILKKESNSWKIDLFE